MGQSQIELPNGSFFFLPFDRQMTSAHVLPAAKQSIMSKTKQIETTILYSLAEAGGPLPEDDDKLTQVHFEILKTGEFFDPRYGVFEITEEKLERLKNNFDQNVLGIDLAVDVSHMPEKGAFAWINELIVEDGKLYMSLKDITSEGVKILREKIYKYFSVEFRPFIQVVDGVEMTINDVLRGVAFTNRPVIKGMKPTFLSEDINNESNLMSTQLFTLAERYAGADTVSKADKEMLRGFFNELPEHLQTEELEAKLSKVEAKPATAGEVEAEDNSDTDNAEGADDTQEGADDTDAGEGEGEDTDSEAADDSAEEADDSAEADDAASEGEEEADEEEGNEPDAVTASEDIKGMELSEVQELASKLLAEKRERQVEEHVNSLMLSDDRTTGFTKESKATLQSFVMTLSESQMKKFSGVIDAVKSVDLSELGSSAPAAKKAVPFANLSEDEQVAAAEKEAEAILSEQPHLQRHEAIAMAQKKLMNN